MSQWADSVLQGTRSSLEMEFGTIKMSKTFGVHSMGSSCFTVNTSEGMEFVWGQKNTQAILERVDFEVLVGPKT